MVVLSKIYTRTGDAGDTALGDGTRVRKHALRVESYGTVDELNSCVGMARLHAQGTPVDAALAAIQNDLFDLGADLCRPEGGDAAHTPLRMTDGQVDRLEQDIDAMTAQLEPLRSFILPGGTPLAVHLHLCRTVARRAERLTVALSEQQRSTAPRCATSTAFRLALRRRAHGQRRRPRRRALGAGRQPLSGVAPRSAWVRPHARDSMTALDPRPVVLTGASGFIAKHVARRLLEDGHAVRATLRSPARAEEVRAAVLPGLPEGTGDRLTFARADLLSDDGWAEAMAGASALIHTASPFPQNQPRDRDELIRPAVEGTRRALRAAADAGVGPRGPDLLGGRHRSCRAARSEG
jgi:cob(I)alamin adenosyltransferase